MNALQKSQRILIGLAIGILLALLIAPQTGWLTRDQLGAVLLLRSMNFGIGLRDEPPSMSTYKAFAEAHPDDFPVQFAYVLMSTPQAQIRVINYVQTDDPQIDALHQLTTRFGDQPSLYANILRISTRGIVRTGDRPENYLISGTSPPPATSNTQLRSSDTVLAQFDQDAAAGERLDPDNAYFSFMRAYGLFAMHKDDDAIAAILRAGQKTQWKEYYDDQVTGQLEMNEAVVGGKDSLSRLAIAAALLFPHYASLREAARIATYKAMLLEQSGQVDQGLAIRFALMHCGSLMRVQSTSVIGCLVGIAITAVAMDRPGGAVPIANTSGESGDQREKERLDRFCAYLSQVGHSDDAVWVRAESAAGDQTKAVIRRGTSRNLFVMAPVRAGVWWGVDMLILSCACWMLILALAASLLARTAQIQSGEPLAGPVRWGIGSAFVALSLGLIISVLLLNRDDATVWVFFAVFIIYLLAVARALFISKRLGLAVLILVPLAVIATLVVAAMLPSVSLFVETFAVTALVVLLIWLVVRGGSLKASLSALLPKSLTERKPEVQDSLKAFGITLCAATLLTLVAYWQIHWLEDISSLLSVFNDQSPEAQAISIGIEVQGAIVAVLLLLPAGIMAIVSLVRKVPLSITLTLSYRDFGAPLACILLIGYGVCVLFTMRAEREGNYVLEQITRHEGAYYAQVTGQQWPGPVPEPEPTVARS